jgi:transcriptional regulator with XRE-family HTH domain
MQDPPLRDLVRRRIRALRVERGLSQEALCERACVSVDAVSRIEGGSRVPTLDTLEKLADALGVTVIDLLRSPRPATTPARPVVRRVVALLEREPPPVQEAAETVVRAMVRALHRAPRKGRR